MQYSIERAIRLGFLLAFGLVVAIAAAAYLNVRRAQEAMNWARQSREVLGQITTTLSVLQDVETGTRGYLLTGEEAYLAPYREATLRVDTEIAHLKQLTADDPTQQERIRELQAAADDRLMTAKTLITGRQNGTLPPAEVRNLLDRGKASMDRVRTVLGDMNSTELEVHERRRQAFADATSRSLWIIAGLGSVMFALLIACYLLLHGHLQGRRRAEAALHESEERSRLILDSAAEAICGVDSKGICTFANRATLKTLGYQEANQLVGQSVHKLAHHTRADGSFYPVNECPIVAVVEQGLLVHNDQEIFWRPDGTNFPVEYWSYPIRRGAEITGAVVTFVDITDRKRAESELQEAHRKLSSGIQELEARGREITLISEMTNLLQTCNAQEEAYRIVAQYAGMLFPAVGGALGIINPSRDLVDVVTHWGNPALTDKTFGPEDCWGLRSGRPYTVDQANSRLMCKHVAADECCGTFCVPMMALGESLGIVFMSCESSGCSITSAGDGPQKNLAVAFTESVSLGLANLQLRETLRMQSIRDPLTGLFNRRYMEAFFDREMKRALRNQRPIGVVIFDIDHFKRYNDTFGHDAGDVLLKEAAALFRSLVRGEDIACRYGGEEFLLLMPDASLEITHQRAESLRSAVEHLHVERQGQPLGTVTVSLGVAVYPEHGTTTTAVLRAADQALYRAKQGGRNRVVVAEKSMNVQSG